MQQLELIIGAKVRVLRTRTRNLQQWVGREAQITGIQDDKIYVDAGDGSEKKHLTLKPGWFEVLPVPHAQQQLEPETLQFTEDEKLAKYEEELLTKVYLSLPDSDIYITLPEIARELTEYAGVEIRDALKKLEEQELAKPFLNSDGGEILWQKDVNALVAQQQLQSQQQLSEKLQEQAQPQPQTQEESSPSTIFAQESDLDSQQLQLSSEDLKSLDSAKLTTTVGESLNSDTPIFKLTETSEMEQTLEELKQGLSALRSQADHLLSQENGKEPMTTETFSPTFLSESTNSNQIMSALKTPQEFSAALLNQEEPPEDFLSGYFGSFPDGGTFWNGKLSAQVTLMIPPLLESELFWLRSPKMSLLASNGNSDALPGASKLEMQLRELALVAHNQVVNPEYLARGLFNLPASWLSQLELRSAAQIFGISASPTEAPKTGELERSPLEESNISNQSESVQVENRSLMSVPDVNPQNFDDQEAFSLEDFFTWRGPGKYWIKPEWVDLEESTQYRVKEDDEWIRFCQTCMEDDLWEWQTWALGLIWTGENLILYRGHHRLKAAIKAKKPALAEIKLGDLAEAKFLSVGSNKFTSVTPTVADNKNAIITLLDLQKEHGDEWLLNLINQQLPLKKRYKEVSLRALESYTGIPFRTIKNIKDRAEDAVEGGGEGDVNGTKAKVKISFKPSEEEKAILEQIMQDQELENFDEVVKWLIANY